MNTNAKQIHPTLTTEGDLVLQEIENGVATLTLNRPKQFNALSEAMLTSLQKKLDGITGKKEVRLVILQGAGKVFCAGHDLKEMIATRKETYYKTLFMQCSRMMMPRRAEPSDLDEYEIEIEFSHREKMREARRMRASLISRSSRSMRIIESIERSAPSGTWRR